MPSKKQIAANQSNGKKGTGPRTAVGKAQSRQNAWKHGFTAERIVVGDEDRSELEALHASLQEDWNPVGVTECMEVQRLATVLWRLKRIPEFEAAVMDCRRQEVADNRAQAKSVQMGFQASGDLEIDPQRDDIGSALIQDSRRGDTLAKLQRYEAFLSNSWTKSIQRLAALQAARFEREKASRQIKGWLPDGS